MTNLKAAVLAIGFIAVVSFKQVPQQKVYIIRYTPEELQATYNAIVKLPYEQAAPLVASLQRQIAEQDAPPIQQQQTKKDSTTKQNKKQ